MNFEGRALFEVSFSFSFYKKSYMSRKFHKLFWTDSISEKRPERVVKTRPRPQKFDAKETKLIFNSWLLISFIYYMKVLNTITTSFHDFIHSFIHSRIKIINHILFNRYDARETVNNATAWSDEVPRGFGSRARFDPNTATLYVDNLQTQENGLYRCRVDFKRSQTRNHLVNLTVIGNNVLIFLWFVKYKRITIDRTEK